MRQWRRQLMMMSFAGAPAPGPERRATWIAAQISRTSARPRRRRAGDDRRPTSRWATAFLLGRWQTKPVQPLTDPPQSDILPLRSLAWDRMHSINGNGIAVVAGSAVVAGAERIADAADRKSVYGIVL